MPPIYGPRCHACHHEGPTCAAGYQAFVRDSDEVVPLPHPSEGAALHQEGHTFDLAGVRGRYARVQLRVCSECGLASERVRLGYPVSLIGCLGGWLVSAGVARVFGLPWTWTPLLAPAGFVVAPLVALALTPVVRLVYGARGRRVAGPRVCPGCGGHRLLPLAQARDLPCPSCGARAWRYEVVGVS